MSPELAVREKNPQEMIALAIEKGADPAFLSRLLDVQERWEANVAKKAYVAAMSAFKQEAPSVMKKADRVDFKTDKGRTAYNYANLGSIVQEISAILGKHDLSASWETSQEGNIITVWCHVTHAAGHRESVKLAGPSDQSGNKNPIQAIGSTVTYLQRYTLLAALGLATGEDDDGDGAPEVNGKPAVKMPTEKGATPTPFRTKAHEDIASELALYCNGNATKMEKVLEEITEWTGSDNKFHEGKKNIADITDKAAGVVLGKLRKLIKEYPTPLVANSDSLDGEPLPTE
jgi:hypothetical protein